MCVCVCVCACVRACMRACVYKVSLAPCVGAWRPHVQCCLGKSALTVYVHVLQAMMEKLSMEVEKNLKLNSQLEETGDSKKV